MSVRQWLVLVVGLLFTYEILVSTRSGNFQAAKESHSQVPQVPAKVGAPTLYPDANRTPGATNRSVNQGTISQTICRAGWTKAVRPSNFEMNRIKAQMIKKLGATGASSQYELDHFIPLELGGCPDCIENLWLEPYSLEPGARQKDEVERYLHTQVCKGSMSLEKAQNAITADWYKIYLEIHKPQGK